MFTFLYGHCHQYPLFARSREKEHTLRNLLVMELLGPQQSKLRLVPGH